MQWALILKAQKLEKMPVRVLYGNREFHVPFWSMIYLALKFDLNANVSFRNSVLILIASKF